MKDFIGFRFGNIHSKDLHLIVVSSSNRYEKNLLPENKDYSIEVPGGNGSYYFGSTFGNREFKVEVAFDNIDEKTWRRISNLFATDKLQDLVFDELPYKTYRAKIKSKPEFKFICFTDRETGERVYKGEGTLNFICYQPFAYGFNKYIIRAADEYQLTIPKLPNYEDRFENPYEKQEQKIYNKDTKEYYNVKNNMNIPWKGGYPTIEQVKAGELYFTDKDGNKKIIDVRDYFRNVPEWADSSKLLTTPTLDFDQDLIFLPQYSKSSYINMDTGFIKEQSMIGSRILVYNPGDLPIDFELKTEHVERAFHLSRGVHFQIRRFNVQRLSIANAVDWTGLKTLNEQENKNYKYGNKYFKLYSNGEYQELNEKHPSFTYVVEPIPKEKLGHYIKLFYWQSSLIKDEFGKNVLDFETGIELANRYEELYDLCITEEEKYQLYWETLNTAILNCYQQSPVFSTEDFEEFKYNYIHNPPEFIHKNPELFYGQEEFNVNSMPQWYSQDYLDINTENIEKSTLFLDSEKKMLYNINNPEYKKNDVSTYKNWYNYKPTKTILNDNIIRGHWFKLPPGWSLLEIIPICDEDNWGGKRWLDSRPFNWGYGGDENYDKKLIQKLFDVVYDAAAKEFLGKEEYDENELNFHYEYNSNLSNFESEYYVTKKIQQEYRFLKIIHKLWKDRGGDTINIIDGQEVKINGSIDEWWWYACNYMWANFPPLYWGYADILNDAKIKYTPLFY